jgi:hypothetical protein
MATRLEITHGLIAERDRLATSADTLSVTRPSTGSKTRSKGVLFLLVGSSLPGPRAREASALVAETIRHEYYYDESAGVPVCLEKAIKSADRRLRSSREGAGLPPGTLGVAAAVIRNNELYLATVGAVDAYLVRSARLLMPERGAPSGLPLEEGRPLEVWRGEAVVGDELLLVSRNLTETVGTEELKSAVLTLHPQAAANHLHHLFVAAGGEGSDGIITVEAREQTSRTVAATTPVAVGDSYGDLPGVLPEPVGASVGTTLLGARGALDSLVDRFWEAMPRRRARAFEVEAQTSRAETQRRAAMGLLALVGVVFLLGLFVILVPRSGDVTDVSRVADSDNALALAQDSANRADNLIANDPATALEKYREAWSEIGRARVAGVAAPALDVLEERVTTGLDRLYGATTLDIKRITNLADESETIDPVDLVAGRRKGAFFIDRDTSVVKRVNTRNGRVYDVISEGDKPRAGRTIARPVQLADGGTDVVIVDADGRPFGWRSSNSAGGGTLRRVTLRGEPTFTAGHGDVAAYNPGPGGYRMYVTEPDRNMIKRYQQTLDQSAFDAPSDYLVSQSSEVADMEQIYVDFNVYALIDNAVRKYIRGRYQGDFALALPPDDADIRPGHDYTRLTGSASVSVDGRLYVYDALHERVIGFSKDDGRYLGQWQAAGSQLEDLRGMYVVDGATNRKRTKRKADTLYWVTPRGLYSAELKL